MICQRWQHLDLGEYLSDPRADSWSAFRAHYPTCAECSGELAVATELEQAIAATSESVQHVSSPDMLAYIRSPGSLDSGRRSQIVEHLEACGQCQDEVTAFRGLDLPSLIPPPVATQLEAEPARKTGPLPRLLEWLSELISIPAPALAVGAMALVALFLGLALWPGIRDAGRLEPDPTGLAQSGPPQPVPERQYPKALPAPSPSRIAEEPAAPPASEPERMLEGTKTIHVAESGETDEDRVEEAPSIIADQSPESPTEPTPELSPVDRTDEIVLALNSLGTPLYGMPADVLLGTRIDEVVRTPGSHTARPIALAPDHAARTLQAGPTLLWTIAESSSTPYRFVLVDDRVPEPVLEIDVTAERGGIQAVALSEYRIELESGVVYQWFLLVPPDHAGGGTLSGGAIERIEPTPELAAELERSSDSGRVHLLAGAGLWYDAIAELSHWIELRPLDTGLRTQRTALLEQVGLAQAVPGN